MVKRKKMTTLGALIPAIDTGAKKQGAVSTRRAAAKKKAAPIAVSAPPVADKDELAKVEVLKTSIYLPLPVDRELNQLAMNESQTSRKKVHDYFLEAIDLLLADRGRPSIAKLVEKA